MKPSTRIRPDVFGKDRSQRRGWLNVGGEIVNFDSVKIYKGSDRDRETKDEEKRGVPHHRSIRRSENSYTAGEGRVMLPKDREIESRNKIRFSSADRFYLRTLRRLCLKVQRPSEPSRAAACDQQKTRRELFIECSRASIQSRRRPRRRDYVRTMRGWSYFQTGKRLSKSSQTGWSRRSCGTEFVSSYSIRREMSL